MTLAVLFSGGKDSCFACYEAMKKEKVACLITILSKNPESYMFHTPNITLTKIQADAMELPLLTVETEGEKEGELNDLKRAIEITREEYGIEGVVTGAIRSVYQASRVKKICNTLSLLCLNPLWHVDQTRYMKEFVSSGFMAMISGVFAHPFDESWLGKVIDDKTLEDLGEISRRFGVSLTGEGGEFETFVFDGPIFKKRIEILEASTVFEKDSGVYMIKTVRLAEK
jgi:ABC transporter with metal-binding/Fe-S-binding domain ATP-binding protein